MCVLFAKTVSHWKHTRRRQQLSRLCENASLVTCFYNKRRYRLNVFKELCLFYFTFSCEDTGFTKAWVM